MGDCCLMPAQKLFSYRTS